MISAFFIKRPKAAIVLSVIIFMLGLIALQALPVKEYPTITPPQITVTINYPGADAETIAKAIAAPIESAINGVENMLYMVSSSSSSGIYTLNIFFEIGTDPNAAKMDVNNRIQLILPRLPEEVRKQGIQVRERSPDFLKVIAFYSKGGVRDPVDLSNFISLHIVDEIKRLPGVGDVIIFDEKNYSMRIWLLPDKLYQYNLTPLEVFNTIIKQNQQFSAGVLSSEPIKDKTYFTIPLKGETRFERVSQFAEIVLKEQSDGSTLKLKDVAKIELSSESFNRNSFYKKEKVIPVGIFLSSNANALEVSKKLDLLLEKIAPTLPPDIKFFFPYDPTIFIKETLKEVIFTFAFALFLVVLVIYFFLGYFRTSLIPIFAIPVSIIGCFSFLFAFGFSINLLTLFGTILAIGLVVDDAIIVIENTERIIKEEGLSPKEAALKSMEEISSPVIAIVLVLSAVFIPASFIGGFTGKFYQQFAITIATSMVLSGIVALTLTPALCALILTHNEKKPILPIRVFQSFFDLSQKLFVKVISFILKKPLPFLVLYIIIIPLTFYIVKNLPTGLVPVEDKSALMLFASLPPGSSLKRGDEILSRIENKLLSIPEVDKYVAISGIDFQDLTYRTDSAGGFIKLKEWNKRKDKAQSSFALAQKLNQAFSKERDALIFVANLPPIMGLGRTGGFELYIQDITNRGTPALFEVTQRIIKKANERPELMSVRTTFDPRVPYYTVKVDRTKAYAYNVEVEDIYKILSMTYGASYVNDFNLFGRVYRVFLQAEGDYRNDLRNFSRIYVKNKRGDLIPLSNFVTFERVSDAMVLQRFNMYSSAKILGEPKPGYTSGEALKAIMEVVKEVLPEGYKISFGGASFQELRVQEKSVANLIYALTFIYLILVALYESWLSPLIILLYVPFSIFGAALTMFLFKLENDIYFQVALVTLIGLSAKNAILLVEFAEERVKKGKDLFIATLEAARLRYRPIMMTSFAFIAGALPLAISSGAGSASRHIIGWAVVGGMLFATLIGIYFIPLLYYFLKKISTQINKAHILKLSLLFLVFLLVSCAPQVKHEKPSLALPSSFTIDQEGESERTANFWENFKDPFLNNLIEEALKNNDDLQIVSYRMEQILKKIKLVEADKWPILQYNLQGKRERSSEEIITPNAGKTMNTYQLNLTVGYELDLFKRFEYEKKSLLYQYLANAAGKKTLELTITTLITNTYFDLLASLEKLKIAENFLTVQKAIYEFREKQLFNGLIDILPLLQAQTEIENTKILIENLKKEIKFHQDNLALLLGREPKELFENKIYSERSLPQPFKIPAFLPSVILEKRPDIIQAENILKASEYEVARAKRDFFPRITLTSALGFQSQELSNLIQGSAHFWNLAGFITGTLLDFGRKKSLLELKEEQKKEALYEYIKTVKRAFFEVSIALTEMENIEKKLKETEKKLQLTEKTYKLSQLKFERGLINYLTVLEAERQYLSTKLELITLKCERLKALILFIKAIGGNLS